MIWLQKPTLEFSYFNTFPPRVPCSCILLSPFSRVASWWPPRCYCLAFAFVSHFPEHQFSCLDSWGLYFITAIGRSISLHSQLFLQLHSLVTVGITHPWGSILIASVSCVSTLPVFILPRGSPPSSAQYFRTALSLPISHLLITCFTVTLWAVTSTYQAQSAIIVIRKLLQCWKINLVSHTTAQHIKTGY